MNSALEILFQRRPAIDYVSPAICEAAFSSTGGPVIVLDALGKLVSITGVVFGSTGHPHRLSWNRFPGALCYSVYKLVDELDPFGPYMLVAECISDEFIDLDEEGTYKVTAITPDGETPFGEPFHVVFPAVPPSEVTLDFIDMDQALDFSKNATVIVGLKGSLAALYKSGSVSTFSLPGSNSAFFTAVSPNGHWAVGYDNVAGIDNMVSYDSTTYRNLGNDGFLGTGLFDVNNSGHALSTSKRIIDATTAGVLVDLGLVDPGVSLLVDGGRPWVINEADHVPLVDATNNKTVLYAGGSITDIRPPDWLGRPLGVYSNIINDLGHVAGEYVETSTQNRSFFFNGSSSASIGDFGGFVTARGMSDTDWVVGQCDNGSSYYGAFRWSPTHPLEMLPVFPDITPGAQSIGLSVNDAGWIVGFMDDRAFVFRDGTLIDLNDLIPAGSDWDSLEIGDFINNLNQVVGRGTRLGVGNQVFLMQLV